MSQPPQSASPLLKARLAGVFYLLTIGVGAFDHLTVGRGVVIDGDAVRTAHNLIAAEPLYRLAFALDLLPVYVVVTVLFYQLLKPVSPTWSLLAAAMSLVGGAVGSAIAVMQLQPVLTLVSASALSAFNPVQRDQLAMLMLDLHATGFLISLVFFGSYCLILGGLIFASRFMPRLVGLLLALGGAAYLGYSLTDFVAPSLAAAFAGPALLLGSLGEGVLTLWLLIFGVDAAKWRQRAS